ncbi:mitochondrial ATP synthase D chain-related protein [Striga asiatica]|uniref:Mitochondrial ATP synthase D chain-related protein n=1 Tax=Striga asiatica TaxID=4170 RepID=A0A5A7Q8K0_STRAF|nr:mitochondrial ATP synthase D chain-related protein [Striga asiatica]
MRKKKLVELKEAVEKSWNESERLEREIAEVQELKPGNLLPALLMKLSNYELRAFQVIELESSKEGLLDDKLQLTQTVSGLQLQIRNLENAAAIHLSSVDNKVMEAACAQVEKLVLEYSEHVVKGTSTWSTSGGSS